MIDWYVILFVAITLLIFYMKEFGEHPDSSRYIQDHVKVPVSAGTTQLLFRLMTGTFLFIPFYFTITYGYMAGFALVVSGSFVLYVFSTQVEELSGKITIIEDRYQFLKSKFTKKGLIAFYGLMMVAAAEGLIISTMLAHEFLKQAFGISSFMAAMPILFFSFIFAGMGGIRGMRKIGTWLIMMFFIGISVIPLSAFLINGAKPIYITLYAENSTNLDIKHLLIGALLFMPVIAGHLMVYFFMSHDLMSIKRNRVRISIGLSSICWSSIPLAISLIVLYLLAITGSKTTAGLLAGLQEHMPVLLVYILVFVVLSSLATGIGLSLYKMSSMILTIYKGKAAVQRGYLFSLLLCAIPIALLKGFSGILELSIIFYANLFASLGFPIWLTIKAKIRWGADFGLVLFLSVLMGSWISFKNDWMIGVPVSIGLSSLIALVLLVRNIRKVQK
jgi:hypothetical protein